MTTSCEAIVELYHRRLRDRGAVAARWREIRDAYNGDLIVPLPELERSERNFTANLTATGIDQIATRIASTVPDITFPTHRASDAERQRARNRREAVTGWWDENRMGLKLRHRARWLVGYGLAPVKVRPDFKMGYPRWEVCEPLSTFPGPSGGPDDPCVPDCIYAVRRSWQWLTKRYPAQAARLAVGGRSPRPDDMFDVLEFEDCDELVTCVIGEADSGTEHRDHPEFTGEAVVQLERIENRAGVCTAVVPRRINLDRCQGQFDGMVGMHQMQARLFALEVIAVEKGIFPDDYLVGRQNETPQIIQEADGRHGVVGVVTGGDFRQVQLQPGYQAYPTIDRLERSQRITAGIPAEFGGESQSNVRTGRRGENILSATIDFGIQESQQILAASLEAENMRAIAVDKGYHNVAKSFYVGYGTEKADYTPSELFTTDRHTVSYAHAGTDANGLVISLGQRHGMGTLSKRGLMERDPMIDDPELELDRVTSESLEMAMLQSIQMQASQGAIPPADLARIMQLVVGEDKPLADAIVQAQEEAQERQAMQVPADDPAAQPGLAMPGMGAEAQVEAPMEGPSLQGLSSLMTQLRRPQMELAVERPLPEAAVG